MKLLDGIKILSFTHYLAGPLAAQTLADLGADVIAVEPIEGAFQRNWAVADHFVDGVSVNHLATGRNKRSIAVDLKHLDGIAAVKKLVASADVVMENFRPGTMAKLGLGYDVLKAINPSLIYAVATGFGSDGPYKDRPGVDQVVQGMSGLMSVTGEPGRGPMRVGVAITDIMTGLYCALGIMTANPKTFIVAFLTFWYVVVNDKGGNPLLDFAGFYGRFAPATIAIYAGVSVGAIVIAQLFYRARLNDCFAH